MTDHLLSSQYSIAINYLYHHVLRVIWRFQMDWIDELDLPYLATVPDGQWVNMLLDPRTGRKGENDRGWGCLYIRARIEDRTAWEEVEVPFWGMRTLARAMKEYQLGTGDKGVVEARYSRVYDPMSKTSAGLWIIGPAREQVQLPDGQETLE